MTVTVSGARFATVCVVLCVLSGCTQIIEKLREQANADAGSSDTAATDAATTGTGAKNEADVLRYEREEKLANEPAAIAKDGTQVRTIPGSGSVVATLAHGTPVMKVAKYFATGVLVAFDDPAGGTLIGWVAPSALTTPAAATGSVKHPPAAGGRDGGPPASPVTTDAGTKPADAGAAKAADAGAPKAVADAGARPATSSGPTKYDATWKPENGKCPEGFFLSGPLCRRKCAVTDDCPRGLYCVAGPGGKYCSTDNK